MTFSLETATLPEMKKFAATNEIVVSGDKRVRSNWASCIEKWQTVGQVTTETLADSEEIVEKVEVIAEVVATKVVETLTSPTAVTAYKTIFHVLALVIVLVGLLTWKVAKWAYATARTYANPIITELPTVDLSPSLVALASDPEVAPQPPVKTPRIGKTLLPTDS